MPDIRVIRDVRPPARARALSRHQCRRPAVSSGTTSRHHSTRSTRRAVARNDAGDRRRSGRVRRSVCPDHRLTPSVGISGFRNRTTTAARPGRLSGVPSPAAMSVPRDPIDGQSPRLSALTIRAREPAGMPSGALAGGGLRPPAAPTHKLVDQLREAVARDPAKLDPAEHRSAGLAPIHFMHELVPSYAGCRPAHGPD